MKKVLIVFLVLILVGAAFFTGTKFNKNNDVEVGETTIKHDEEYTTEAYKKGFRGFSDFNILLKVKSYCLSETVRESYVVTNIGTQGYYLENSYVAPAWAHSTKAEERYSSTDWLGIWSEEERLRSFKFADDYTLSFASGKYSEAENIIINDIIESNEHCTIFEATIDRFGFENDEYNVCFFAFRYEDMMNFDIMGTGEKSYTTNGPGVSVYSGFKDLIIYF